jgi:hypothetical protein
MARTRLLIAMLALVAGAGLSEAAASAAPSTPNTLTYEFTGCTGPGPTEFDAVKQPGEAAALHLTDGSGVFIALAAVDVETEAELFKTPGFERNALSETTITCSVVNPRNGREQLVTGLIVPVG